MFEHDQLYEDPVNNTVVSIFHHISIVWSLIVNCTLVVLILKCRRTDFGAYRFLLLTFATVDVYYALVHFLVMPIPETWGNAFCMAAHGYLKGKIAVCWFAGVHSHSFVVLGFHFLYRLFAVKRSPYIELFSRFWFLGIQIVCVLLVGISWYCVLYYLFDDDSFAVDYVLAILKDHAIAIPLPVEDYSTAVFWTNGTFVGPRWSPICGVLVMAVTMSGGYGFMMYSTYKIRWYMIKNSGVVSKRTNALQKQLMKALMYQTILPLVTAYSPPLISVVTPFLGITIRMMSFCTPYLCGTHPWLDGCVLIWTIKEYRMLLLGCFLKKQLSEKEPRTTSTIKQGPSIVGHSSHF